MKPATPVLPAEKLLDFVESPCLAKPPLPPPSLAAERPPTAEPADDDMLTGLLKVTFDMRWWLVLATAASEAEDFVC